MITRIILLLIFFLPISIKAQVYLYDYSEEENEITLKLTLDKVEFLNRSQNQGYWDESKPGEFALPNKSIIIGLPRGKNFSFSTNIIKESQEEIKLGINPTVTKTNRDFLSYNFKPEKIVKSPLQPLLKVKGYFWQQGIYCVNVEINQFKYDDIRNILSSVDQLEIKVNFTREITADKKSQSKVNSSVLNTLINGIYAADYFSNTDSFVPEVYSDDWIDYSKEYIKIGVAEDGIYRIGTQDLFAIGATPNLILPKTIKLFLRGKEIPIFIEGEDDNIFDDDDYIEFVGNRNMGGHHRELSSYNQPYNEYLGRYTDTTVYWLTWGGSEGKRVGIVEGQSQFSAQELYYYYQIDHYEENGWYNFSLDSQVRRQIPFWTENQSWFEGNITVGVKNEVFNVDNLYPESNFKIYCKVQDYASSFEQNPHHLAMGINSDLEMYDSTYINKYEKSILKVELPTNKINNGENKLKIYSFETGSYPNLCVFDWFEVEYPRSLVPIDKKLNFSFPQINEKGEYSFYLTDIENGEYSFWRCGQNLKKINVNVVDNKIFISDSISGSDRYYFSAVDALKDPKLYYKKTFLNLRSKERQSDYIAITHGKFLSQVQGYNDFISSAYSLKTELITVDDIYDEFSYGFFNPEAIKDFLKSTHLYWKSDKPQYITLIGGATYDYYGNKNKYTSVIERVINYVPSFGEPVSDNWFVIWDTTGAYIPQMNIGRIPVTSNEELARYIERHRTYINQDFDLWNKSYLFYSGGDSDQIEIMKAVNQKVVDDYVTPIPIGGKVEHFYKTNSPQTDFGPFSQEYIQNVVDKGAILISYIGHSGTQIWDNSIIDPLQLKNTINRSPGITDFGCSTAKFAEPDVTSFSQEFILNEDGQAITYIGNSSLGFTSTALVFPNIYYKKILKENVLTVSEAHKQAKIELLQSYGSSGVYEVFALTNTLVGNPLIEYPIPAVPNLHIEYDDINKENEILNDMMDSVKVGINFYNYGKAIADSVEVLIIEKYAKKMDSLLFKIPMPRFHEIIYPKFSIKNQPGSYSIFVSLDPFNKISEISEDDNNIEFSFEVASVSVRPLLMYTNLNGRQDILNILNSFVKPETEKIVVEYANNPSYIDSETKEFDLDTLNTIFNFQDLNIDSRYWFKTSLKSISDNSLGFSFCTELLSKYSINDSLSFSNSESIGTTVRNNITLIDSGKVNIELASAGFNDGKYAQIIVNDVNYAPINSRGHHVVVLDENYQIIEIERFDLLNVESDRMRYVEFLDTLSSDYLVLFAISDEGTPRLNDINIKLKEYGSNYIDNVGWRSSWAMIGWKGAEQGSVPEVYSKAGTGAVTLDTVITFLPNHGSMLTSEIGPSGNWNQLVVSQEIPSNSKITYAPIGIKNDGLLDTLNELTFQDSIADLSFINSDQYPKIKILARFTVSDDKQSPILKSLGVDYKNVPELATNYQVVSATADSIDQGAEIGLDYQIWNVGETAADSFKISLSIVNSENISTLLSDTTIVSLEPEGKLEFHYDYLSNFDDGYGDMKFEINIDTDNKILEMFEDNNIYYHSFYVIKDTVTAIDQNTVSVLFDGRDIYDGEYISPKPEVKISLNYSRNFKISDSSLFHIFIDNKRVPTNQYEQSYDATSGSAEYSITKNFEDGEHVFEIRGENIVGNIEGASGYKKTFLVTNQAKLIDVYNYPNPLQNDTYFTFKLPQLPEELYISIYTVAGRLIRKIEVTPDQLKYDFNRIYWDGRDQDSDLIANGVYLYKITLKKGDESDSVVQKLAIVR